MVALAVCAALAALAGCAVLPGTQGGQPAVSTPSADLRIPRVLANEGLQKLRERRYEDASRIFNAGIKFSPESAQLHFLNGLTYHLLYQRGDDGKKDLAVTGYEMALAIEPAYFQAALQLGRLELEARRHAGAIEAFRLATDIEPASGEAWMGLATAAYYARDLPMAREAVRKLAPLQPDSAAAARLAAMVHAGLGELPDAKQAALRYASLEPDAGARSQLSRRVEQWGAWHAALPAQRADVPAAEPQLLAQAAAATSPSAPAAAPTAPMTPAVPSKDPAMPRWFDCDSSTAGAAASQGATSSIGSGSADETSPLPALAVPGKGAGHTRMAILDVAIIRTEDTTSSSYGVNLLNGLTYVFSKSLQVTDTLVRSSATGDARTVTTTRQRNTSLTNPANPAGLTYSLNIANATDARSEVLAQPSLVALDRQSSTFFSGRNITLGLAAGVGGSSTFTDKPVGVSLSVTPTFVDEETMLVSARAARSFVEQVDANVSFGQTMQTSRNSVTANVALKFGQTLILSGLAEQEVQRSSDGVPVLQDIPLLQYLFRSKQAQNFTRSVLVLITPRKPEAERDLLAREIAGRIPGSDADKEALLRKLEGQSRQTQGVASSLDAAYRHALESKLFLQFRAGDVRTEDWSTPPRLDGMLQQLKDMLYF